MEQIYYNTYLIDLDTHEEFFMKGFLEEEDAWDYIREMEEKTYGDPRYENTEMVMSEEFGMNPDNKEIINF